MRNRVIYVLWGVLLALSLLRPVSAGSPPNLDDLNLELRELEQLLNDAETRLRAIEGQSPSAPAAVSSPAPKSEGAAPTTIDFNRHIRPILSNKCFKCHGPDDAARKAKLRLDRFEDAAEKGAIVPGDISKSELIAKITTTDPADRMPPAETGLTLSPTEIETLTLWIEQGAEYKKHWSFEKPVQKEFPALSDPNWPKNGVDHFVLAKLDELGMKPSPEADRYTLARRVYLDLTGVPPSIEEVDHFVEDTSPDAYEKLVDRLLQSPQYGERWARMWLDLARYADSMGYEKDLPRSIWPYRDWVIKAFSRDLPFDQFTVEQLAGDLLENPTTDQLVATGFHRNTMTNTEGGTDNEEFRYAAVVDRVNTTMETWMGLTMGCAQCHNHKYDPILQKEYYQFFAFFDQTEDADKDDESPTIKVPSDEQAKHLSEIDHQIDLVQDTLDTTYRKLELTQSEWEPAAIAEYAQAPKLGPWSTVGPFLEPDFDLASGAALDTPFRPEQEVNLSQSYRGGKLVWKTQPELGGGEILDATGNSGATYFYREIDSVTDQTLEVTLKSGGALKVFLNGAEVLRSPNPDKKDDVVEAIALTLRKGSNALLVKGIGAKGNYQLTFQSRGQAISQGTWNALNRNASDRAPEAKAAVAAFQRSVSPEAVKVSELLSGLNGERGELVAKIPITSILRELPKEQARETKIHVRGAYLDPADPVSAAFPAVFHPVEEPATLNRLTLARWLVSKENPLTARVLVNRFWEQFFGTGLVETVEDFGVQGELPVNQELLDWIAVEFMNKNWSMKELCRLIVTSSAYRQSSKIEEADQETDPFNRYLARGPRMRLDADTIRDQALAVAGLLSRKMYGAPVMPPQPEGVWQVVYSGEPWETSKGEDKHRRGIYTFWRRSSPYPSMVAFDAPSREICTSRRIRTNTPLQALVTLNDPVYIEAAQALARKTVAQGGDDLTSKATYLFRRVLIRPPEPAELDKLISLFNSELEHYRADTEAAKAMATDPLGPVEGNVDLSEHAAWTVVANAVMNLDETVMKR